MSSCISYHPVLPRLPWLDGVVRAKRPQRLPIVLTRDEVRAVLRMLHGVPRLMACLLYGSGLRVLECICTHVLNRGPSAVRSPVDTILGT